MFEALKDEELLKEVLEALDAKKTKASGQKEVGGGQNEGVQEVVTKETKDEEFKAVPKTVSCPMSNCQCPNAPRVNLSGASLIYQPTMCSLNLQRHWTRY